ncbi:hypothetical protein ACFHW2_29635 [Actinomadura sp. LOL_016]|uniref:hypothetical protein n=1 Tax=unclassified Actinomadura TaxID=2626254 RepID=UPI003A7FA49D
MRAIATIAAKAAFTIALLPSTRIPPIDQQDSSRRRPRCSACSNVTVRTNLDDIVGLLERRMIDDLPGRQEEQFRQAPYRAWRALS